MKFNEVMKLYTKKWMSVYQKNLGKIKNFVESVKSLLRIKFNCVNTSLRVILIKKYFSKICHKKIFSSEKPKTIILYYDKNCLITIKIMRYLQQKLRFNDPFEDLRTNCLTMSKL